MTDQEQIVKNYIEAYNNFDIEGMLNDLHPDILFENVSGGKTDLTLRGIFDFEQQARKAIAFFSQRKQAITSINKNNNTVTVDINYTGILAQDLPNGMKKGDTITLKGRSIFDFKDRKITHIRDES
ncbi:nuclear transport factor 2 family protein [Sinomicrobium weinanense]|uniref:Nuclear transport factor 2 family protein n=1 Tax=Sinomicrobium weinanense TaxID=2842200 RepID=A0A926JSY8_9FLAO|nr:nuclear transport factor 2 family protein [Sinomicrobium weinanense]MBC9796950.1 nuclear transport factor 2 family protein [Sinomicrobium weinanense]MBU3124952.1 nuclear transport factor 2 family protein [Sinomicrobium weinanense]